MFTPIRLVHVPEPLASKMEAGTKFIFGSLAVMFAGMILASMWQWAFNIESDTLMDSPLFLRVVMLGGLVAFLISLTTTAIILPLWYDAKRILEYFADHWTLTAAERRRKWFQD